jgi:hypothetical protein
VSAILKLLPQKWTEKVPSVVDEDNMVKDDAIMNVFNKHAKAKVSQKGQNASI